MAGTRPIFTRTMAATDVIEIVGTEGVSTMSILCKTDSSGTRGIAVLGTLGVGGVASNTITLLANESLTVSASNGGDIANLTITAGTGSTGIVTGC